MEKNQNGFIRRDVPEIALPGDAPKQESDVQLAMVYAPYQFFTKMYAPADAMKHGTLFEELYKPLEVGGHPV